MGFTMGTKGTRQKERTGICSLLEPLLCADFVCKAGRELRNRIAILGGGGGTKDYQSMQERELGTTRAKKSGKRAGCGLEDPGQLPRLSPSLQLT